MMNRNRIDLAALHKQAQEHAEKRLVDISNDPEKLVVFSATFHADLLMAGRVDRRVYHEVFGKLVDESSQRESIFSRALAMYESPMDAPKAFAELYDFTQGLPAYGCDHHPLAAKLDDEEASLFDELAEQGLTEEFLLPPRLRTSIREAAEVLSAKLCESHSSREVFAAIEAGRPQSILASGRWDETVTRFDREVLCLLFITRELVMAPLFRHGEHGERLLQSTAYVGPTVRVLDLVQSLILSDITDHLPENHRAIFFDRIIARMNRFKPRWEYLQESSNEAASMLVIETLRGTVDTAIRLSSKFQACKSNIGLIDKLEVLNAPDEWTEAYLTTPLKHGVRYSTAAYAEESGVIASLSLLPGIASAKINSLSAPTEKFLAWAMDSQGNLRLHQDFEFLPLDEVTLGVSNDDFRQKTRVFRDRTLAILKSLTQVWDRFPELFGTEFPNTKQVRILETPSQLVFFVHQDDEVLLRAAIGSSNSTLAENSSRFNIDGSSTSVAICVNLKELESSTSNTGSETPDDSDVEAQAVKEPTSRLTNSFVHRYCRDFNTFSRHLGRFGITLGAGKGSHEHLRRGGFKYTTSRNQRDGTFLVNRQFVRAVLSKLQISEDEFVDRVLKIS